MSIKRCCHLIGLLLSFGNAYSQVVISGQVLSKDSLPLAYANVYLKDVYDGGVSNDSGRFSFPTKAKGAVLLIVSSLGYQSLEMPLLIGDTALFVTAQLQNKAAVMDDIVVTAGTFEVNDKKRGVILKSLDVVTTAGAAGDIYGALQTLPGVLPQSEETGIFVRGGAASESRTAVDGLLIQNPFFGDVPDIPSRGRFNPFQFTGMVFSTGGYSAEYGQALSSVLLLNTSNELAIEDVNSLNVSLVNVSLSKLKVASKSTTLAFGAGYANNRLLLSLNKQYRDWKKPPEGYNATFALKHKTKSGGVLKLQARHQYSTSALFYDNLDSGGKKELFSTHNPNTSIYSSYTSKLGKQWNLYAGGAFEYDKQRRNYGSFKNPKTDWLWQAKAVFSRRINKANFKFGYDLQQNHYTLGFNTQTYRLKNTYTALFAETELTLSKSIVARIGGRVEHASLPSETKASPRLALAFRTGAKSQVSLAYGRFYQSPQNGYSVFENDLRFETAQHLLANFQWIKEKYIFRVEGYYKKYNSLVRFDNSFSHLDNSGYGFAKGIDIFWRDNKGSIKTLDYWISYSYIVSKRSFRNFDFLATPSFAPTHTLSLVVKRELQSIRSRIGATYAVSSGRVFYHPVTHEAEKTTSYQNLNVNFSYQTAVFRKFTVLYLSLNNPLNIDNILAIRYSPNGSYRQEIRPSMRRSFFIGASLNF